MLLLDSLVKLHNYTIEEVALTKPVIKMSVIPRRRGERSTWTNLSIYTVHLAVQHVEEPNPAICVEAYGSLRTD